MKAWLVLTGAMVAAGVAVGTVAVAVGGGDDPTATGAEADPTEAPRTTVDVVRRDLARTEELDGIVGYGQATPLVLAAGGTSTALPAVGDVIEAGEAIAAVDGQPIVVVDGPTPLWRTLGAGVDDGADVLAVEYVLAAMGHAEAHALDVDGEWTAATTEAVEDFQAAHGQDDDGVIELGELVFVDTPIRIDGVAGALGQSADQAGIMVTSPQQTVAVDLAVDDAELLVPGADVQIELATGERLAATVSAVGAAETDEADGTSTLPVTLTVSGSAPLVDGAPVEVLVEIEAADAVLAVPVEALLALAEGGYAVERTVDGRTTELVAVDVGVFADGMVEVAGDLAAGDAVVVP